MLRSNTLSAAALLLGVLPAATLAQDASFDPAQCPAPILVVENGDATLIYEAEIGATVPARDGLVPLVNRDTGKVWYYDTAETSLTDILTLHGTSIRNFVGPYECLITAAGFPDPTRRTRDSLRKLFDAAASIPNGGGGGSSINNTDPNTPDGQNAPKAPETASSMACEGGPRSGTWVAEIGATSIEGCPAMMEQTFAQMSGQLPGPSAQPGQLEFACPFHPDTLELSRTARVSWTATGDGQWTTTDLAAEQFAQIPSGEGGGSHIRWDLTLVSPEEIEFRRSIEIILPETAAAVMGMTSEGCRILGTDRWLRVGD